MKHASRASAPPPWLRLTPVLMVAALPVVPPPAPAAQPALELEVRLSHGPGGMTITPKGTFVIALHQYYRIIDRVIAVDEDGEITTFPDDRIGRGEPGLPVSLDAVQGMECDDEGIVWMVDNGRRNESVPKLVGWNSKEDKLEKVIHLPPPATLPTSYLNDVAVDPEAPYLYVTDPASGRDAALIVVQRETGLARRVLQGHYSALPEDIPLVIEGKPFQAQRADGTTVEPQAGLNPVAVDHKGRWLYFGPLKGRTLYRIATEHLRDDSLRPVELGSRIEGYSEKPICDSITIDSKNNIYFGDLANNTIGVVQEDDRRYRSFVTDPKLLWPDGLCFGVDGRLYFFTSQLHRCAALNRGRDTTQPPFEVFSVKPFAAGAVGR